VHIVCHSRSTEGPALKTVPSGAEHTARATEEAVMARSEFGGDNAGGESRDVDASPSARLAVEKGTRVMGRTSSTLKAESSAGGEKEPGVIPLETMTGATVASASTTA
jgi:hypothetical protein